MSTYVYINSEPQLYTVGFYHGDKWHPESDWSVRTKASARVAFLNGSNAISFTQEITEGVEQFFKNADEKAKDWHAQRLKCGRQDCVCNGGE